MLNSHFRCEAVGKVGERQASGMPPKMVGNHLFTDQICKYCAEKGRRKDRKNYVLWQRDGRGIEVLIKLINT